MRMHHLMATAALGTLLICVPAATAKESPWTLYKGTGALTGEVKTAKVLRAEWKQAGKPKNSLETDPSPFALLSILSPARIVLVDGISIKHQHDIKLRPGAHTIVVMLLGGNVVSEDYFEFKASLSAGNEYQVFAETEKKWFHKGHWAPFLRYRKIS